MRGVGAVSTQGLNNYVKRLAKRHNVTKNRITYLVFYANESLTTLALDTLGYLIRVCCGRRASTARICENVSIKQSHAADEIHRFKASNALQLKNSQKI